MPQSLVSLIDDMSERIKISRAEMIRRMLQESIDREISSKNNYKSAFGLWRNKKIDALNYQQKLRSEWQ